MEEPVREYWSAGEWIEGRRWETGREGLTDGSKGGCMTQCEPTAAPEERLRSGSVIMMYKEQYSIIFRGKT